MLLADNEARISAVKTLAILDTLPEPAFDDAVHLAATICDTPISLITVLDGKRQWFKSKFGVAVSETPQEQAFCAHAIAQSEILIVEDAQADDRFATNPLVTGHPNIRFYAGMPLKTPEGFAVGTLCVIDTIPRVLTAQQTTSLELLAHQIESQIGMRSQIKRMADAIVATTRSQQQVSESNSLFQAFMDNSPMVGFMKDQEGRMLYYNRLFAEQFAISREEWIGKDDFQIWPPVFAAGFRAVDLEVLKHGELVVTEESSPGPDGATIYWRSYKSPFDYDAGHRMLAGMSST